MLAASSGRALEPGWPSALWDSWHSAQPRKGLDLCLARARPSAHGRSKSGTKLALSNLGFQNWVHVVLLLEAEFFVCLFVLFVWKAKRIFFFFFFFGPFFFPLFPFPLMVVFFQVFFFFFFR